MHGARPSFWHGISADELTGVLGRLERRQIPAGSTLLVEGEVQRTLYLVESGTADILVAGPDRHEHHVAHVGPGAALGEMALLTSQPASATVRAVTDMEVVALDEADFHRVASAFPHIYRTLGVIMADKLARTNRRSIQGSQGQISLLIDHGAPPILGYCLASSLAWHTRASTLLLVVTEGPLPPSLNALAEHVLTPHVVMHAPRPDLDAAELSPVRARLMVAPPRDVFPSGAPSSPLLEDLRTRYRHILVQAARSVVPDVPSSRTIHLAGAGDKVPVVDGSRASYTIRAWASTGSSRPDRAGMLHVPALLPEDEQALQAGSLPVTTPAGRALGWAARDLAALKVGLALGAGSTKGYAHFGVLRVLERAGVPVDYVAGTSIGAAVAALCAMGHPLDEAVAIMDMVGRAAWRLGASTKSLLSNAGLRSGLERFCGERNIEDLALPLAVIAADVITQQEVVFRTGLLWPIVLASMSLPGIFPPQCIGNHILVDGGIVNSVPSKVCADMGAGVVIAVRLAAPPSPGAANDQYGRGKVPSPVQTILRSIEIMQSRISTHAAAGATIVVEPNFSGVELASIRRFTEGRRYIPLGEAAAEAALPDLALALPWLRA